MVNLVSGLLKLVKATGRDNWIDEDDEDIRISDSGEALLNGAEPEKLAQPSHLKAPETISWRAVTVDMIYWVRASWQEHLTINDKELLQHFEVFNEIGMRDAAKVIQLKNITYIGDLTSGFETTFVCVEHVVRPPQGRRNSNELSCRSSDPLISLTPQF
jgi:hypothetical protein